MIFLPLHWSPALPDGSSAEVHRRETNVTQTANDSTRKRPHDMGREVTGLPGSGCILSAQLVTLDPRLCGMPAVGTADGRLMW